MSSSEEQLPGVVATPLLLNSTTFPSASQSAAAKAGLAALLDQWEEARAGGATQRLVQVITKISELMEQETAEYYKTDPDPFDDRHPGRAEPECTLGQLLKMLFTNSDFTNTLLDSYVMSSRDAELNSATCRLLLNMAPGLDTAAVFQEKDGLVGKLFDWAQTAAAPLAGYATGLLGRALSVQEVAAKHPQDAAHLGRILIQRLHHLQPEQNLDQNGPGQPQISEGAASWGDSDLTNGSAHLPSPQSSSSPSLSRSQTGSDCCLAPLSSIMEQRFILQYLTPLADHPELLAVFMQPDTRLLLTSYILQPHTQPARLTFDALLCLAALLLHKRFAGEFVSQGGVQKLLGVPRPSLAATGVSFCLYYLAYHQDTMERVCTLPDAVLGDMVSYALWCLESAHLSGVHQATMFFSICFCFRPLLQLFDRQDGLRRLVNLISTLDSDQPQLSDDQVFTSRQKAKHTCLALRRYFEAHLAVKTERIKQSLHQSEGGAMAPQNPFYKPLSPSREQLVEMMDFLLDSSLPLLNRWEPVHTFCSLSCVPLLLRLLSAACDWSGYHGRSETVRALLDILAVLTLVPSVRPLLADTVEVLDEGGSPVTTVGMSIILGVAEGEVFPGDGDIQKAALQVIINCVCAPELLAALPLRRPRPLGGTATREALPLRKPRLPQQQVLMCQLVQNNNGIKVLLCLLSVQTPVTEADLIRALACRALLGLCRSATIRQIISKLPLFTNGHIQQLMKEPVLQDKRSEHMRFCRYAGQLTAAVWGKPRLLPVGGAEVSLAHLQRAELVARSWVTFPQRELLLLIRDHLLAKGLSDTAAALSREADLQAPPPSLPGPAPSCSSTPPCPRVAITHLGPSPSPSRLTPPTSCSGPSDPRRRVSQSVGRILFSPRDRQLATATPTGPRRRRALRQKSDHGPFAQTPAMRKEAEPGQQLAPPTLDDIITDYLREQHARCPHPVATCPPFSLYRRHRCPEPLPRHRHSPGNCVARLGTRPLGRRGGALDRLDTHLVFSRFRPMTAFHSDEGDASSSAAGATFTCAAFAASQRLLLLGTSSGHLQLRNIVTKGLLAEYPCHSGRITHLEPSRDGKLLLTSAAWTFPMSALWSTDGVVTNQKLFADEHHVEFSKVSQDQVVGTKNEVANVYDVQTGQRTRTLYQASLAGQYRRNRATFSPTDQLLLNDGVLWDVRAARPVHKLDKFNASFSGQFHPNGLEVIANTEVWDLRTFHLLHHVPALDQCHLVFNSSATVMYAAVLLDEDKDELLEHQTSPLRSAFRTFDATDYKPITTVDVKRDIGHLCADGRDCYLGVIENQDPASQETVCRLYEVGRCKLAEESGDDHDQDEDDDDEESSDSEDEDLDSLIAAVERIEQEGEELEEELEEAEPEQQVEDLLDEHSEESDAFPTDDWDSMDDDIWNAGWSS